MKRHAVIVAAGRGERVGQGVAKQLRLLGGQTVLDWSLSAFAAADFESVVLVAPAEEISYYTERFPDVDEVVAGGSSRSLSVKNGLDTLKREGVAEDDAVFIHDAARPGLYPALLRRLEAALADADGAAPALPVVDALKRCHSSGEMENIDRADLRRVQTPQAFRFRVIDRALNAGGEFVDDLEAASAIGASLTLVQGHERLAKLTYAEDFKRLEVLLTNATPPRIGTGFDVHAFGPGGHVMLCGVRIEHDRSLAGHSDADVAWHALTDAILGALGLGDIGDHFPPTDPQWKGADSATFLTHAARLARDHGYEISNCDLTLICEAPKIKPYREAMRARTAEVLGTTIENVSVKATTTEGLGFTGRREGIASQAAVILSPALNAVE